jgi:type IV pilus assembly protein PilE
MQSARKKVTGFTMIELLVVITLLGLIAAIALPSYGNYVKKTRRKDAQADLVNISNALERYYTANNTYATATLGAAGIYPAASPIDGNSKYYNLSISAATATGYTLLATPTGAQVGNGRLQLDSTGNKAWNTKDDGSGTDQSW